MSWICCFWDEKRLHSLSQGILSRPRLGYLSIQSPDIQISPIGVCKLRQTIGSWTLRNISWHTPWTVFASLFLNQIPKSHSRQLCVSYYKLNCDSSSFSNENAHCVIEKWFICKMLSSLKGVVCEQNYRGASIYGFAAGFTSFNPFLQQQGSPKLRMFAFLQHVSKQMQTKVNSNASLLADFHFWHVNLQVMDW